MTNLDNDVIIVLPQDMYKLKMMRIITLILIFLMMFFDLATLLGEEAEYSNIMIIPSTDDPCNETDLCVTLSQFANNSSGYLRTNTTLHFLPGKQHLDSMILVENVNTFYMSSRDGNVTIVCNHSSPRFEFHNVSVVHISGLTIIGCAGNKFTNINQLILEDSQFIGHKDIKGTALELNETFATFTQTEFNHNYGSNVISLLCENDNGRYPHGDFVYDGSYFNNEDTEVSAMAGGAIVSTHSNVTIIDSTFEGNSAHAGGAIFAELQSNITIINSTFVGNQATSLRSHQYCYTGGGALYSDGDGSVVVHNSTFEYNTAHWFGGVMATSRSTHNNFTSNIAYHFGGVLSSGNYSSITITNSEFIGNSANYFGGVLGLSNADHSSITITDSEFTNNSANYDGGVLLLSGANHSSITITDSEFTNNSANDFGSVLDMSNADHSSITISDSEFTNNDDRGVMLLLIGANYSSITIIDSEFTNNSANNFGGVLDMSNANHSSITITDSEFTNNSANNSGGVLDMSNADHSSITITDSEFTNNSATDFGGALDMSNADHSSITITDSEFTNNYDGGVLLLIGASYSSITITDSEFTNNSAIYGGGVLFLIGNRQLNMTITNSEFTGNKAHQRYGGVISVLNPLFIEHGNIIITISSCNFTNNSASRGGVVYHSGVRSNASIAIVDSIFVNNKAKSHGGTMYIHGGKFNINFSQFHHNVAHFGGVLWARQANINSHDTSLSHNRAYTDGGVLFSQESTTVIIGANFNHNRADNNGGTMYIDRTVTSITYCNFNHNTAGNDGGVMRSYLSIIDISESEYRNNSANNEGGVFHIDQTNLTVNQTSFTDSKAKDGGVIWTNQGVLKISQCYFVDSNASAGGVMWAGQTTIIADIINISCNYANFGIVYLLESNSDWSGIWYSNNVGSLYAFGGTVTVRKKSFFTNNTQPNSRHRQTKEGGAITVIHGELKFYGNSLLTDGKAESGGALKAIGHSKVHVFGNVTIANNTATDAGGGIYLSNSELICWKGSTLKIQNNTARGKGGGMSATGSHIEINNPVIDQRVSNLLFDSNQATKGGGLFLKMDSKIYIIKSKVINTSKPMTDHITFSLNSAQYGGAIYVSDNGMCNVFNESTVNECFIQILAMYAPVTTDFDPDDIRCQSIDFDNNTAQWSGDSLFGGLLDRCSVSQFAETNINNVNMDYTFSNGTMIVQGYDYFKTIGNIEGTDIGSPPVRVCFCSDGQPNCSYKHDPIQVRKGQQSNISLSLAIVNQNHDPLQEATILSHFHSGNYICQNHIHSM